MFERFTDRARRAVVLAQEEARELDYAYIGTEHLLLGILREGSGVACEALRELKVDVAALREDLESTVGRGGKETPAHVPFTPGAKKVLEIALRESLELQHSYIGTEHLLLSILREGDGIAAQALIRHGVTLERARAQVVMLVPAGNPTASWGVPREAGLRVPVPRSEIRDQLREISDRLAAIERKLGIEQPPAADEPPAG